MARSNFIAGAIQHPGALRKTARSMHLIKGGQTLSVNDLATLRKKAKKTGNTTLLRRVNFAKTLRSFH